MPHLDTDPSARLRQYAQVARQSLDGNIRFSEGDGNRVVNKGALGHRLAGIIKSIGEKLGLVRPDPTRAQRQENAIKDFVATLKSNYGDDYTSGVVTQLLRESRLEEPGTRLTGRKVLQVLERVEQLQIERAKLDGTDGGREIGIEAVLLLIDRAGTRGYRPEDMQDAKPGLDPGYNFKAYLQVASREAGVPMSTILGKCLDELDSYKTKEIDLVKAALDWAVKVERGEIPPVTTE